MDSNGENPQWLATTLLPAGRRIARAELPSKLKVGLPEGVTAFVEMRYKQWDGHPGEWHDSMGKSMKCVYPLDRKEPFRSCNEVEVAKLLRSGLGYEAFFLTTFWIPDGSAEDRPDWRPWTIKKESFPAWLRKLDYDIRRLSWWPKKTGGGPKAGGMPDVVGWDPGATDPARTAVFVECKGAGEATRQDQWPWFSAAIELGVPAERFGVAYRPF